MTVAHLNAWGKMKKSLLIFGFIVLTLAAAVVRAQTKEGVLGALALICDQPQALGSPEYSGAAKIFAASFPVERLTKLGLSDKALAWLPEFGPCGGPGSPLLVAFFASVARDSITAQKDQVIYRAWNSKR